MAADEVPHNLRYLNEQVQRLREDSRRASIDGQGGGGYHEDMNASTPTEIDLKLENMQLRMDGRLASIEGKMDALVAQVAGSERAMTLLSERAVAAAESAATSADRAGNLKQTLWVTSISTILSVLGIALALYFGIQSSNLAIVQTTFSAVEAGRAVSQAQPPASAPQAPAPAQPPAN